MGAVLILFCTILLIERLHNFLAVVPQEDILMSATQPPTLAGFPPAVNLQGEDTALPSQSNLSKLALALPPKVLSAASVLQTKEPSMSSPYMPLCNKFYKDAHEDSDLLVVPRRAYYDNRNAWSPKQGNVVVVLTEMSDLAFNTIKSCEINGYYTNSLMKIREDTRWVRKKFPSFTYSLVLVECVNVPTAALVHGCQVHLIHKQESDDCYSRVESEYPLVMKPAKPGFIERGAESIVVCVSVFKQPHFLNEWLKYQKHIGVDMVHIAADASFSANGTSAYPFLKEALDSGFARIETWKNPLGKKIYYYSQLLKYQDCVMKYLDVFQYAFLLDSDEFFTPLIPSQKSIGYYVENLYSVPSTVTVCFQWINYFCQVHPSRSLDNGNLTATLDNFKDRRIRTEEKCLHKLSELLFVGIHCAFKVINGRRTRHVSDLAYVAHLKPRNEC